MERIWVRKWLWTKVLQDEDMILEVSKDWRDKNNDTEEWHNQSFLNPLVGFTCSNCEFVAKNKGGLKKHKKHTNNWTHTHT